MSAIILVMAIIALLIGFVFLIKLDICYFPALFFAVKFAAGRMLDFDRARNNVMFQLFIIILLMVTIIVRRNGKWRVGDKMFYSIIPAILTFLVFYSIIGLLNGHETLQIFIDCYKYLEIIVYYILLRASWEKNKDVFRGIKALSRLMLVLGVIEIFITSRGGVGLNLIMSLFPMVMIWSLYNCITNAKIILVLSFLVVVTCQTRTYIVGFTLGFVALLILLPKEKRDSIISFTFFIGVFAVIAIDIFGGKLLEGTLERFMELSSGFEESGGYRIYDYQEAFNGFLNHPILGNGFGYLKRTYIMKMGWMDWGDFVHCLYLEILFKVGISGTLYLLVFFGKFINQIWRNFKSTRGNNNFIFAVCCGSICSFISWAFTYTFAPLSTIGSMFLGPLIASITLSNYYDEKR